MELGIFLVSLAMTAASEVAAYLFRLWTYRSPWYRVANVIVPGLFLGWLSTQIAHEPLVLRFAVGALFGLAYEAANLLVFQVWTFPGDRLLFLRGRPAIVFATGVPWGLLPVLSSELPKWIS
jgi:hypothetical protein